ncbi:MAG TPA: sigma-70 family RNA polymerase sigma factor [Niabella sp.]|nr:sigma-70 family RNA polymerase sigma factor [Niabella sp.]
METVVSYSDLELFERIFKSDEKAFKIYFERHWDIVYGTALKLTKQPEQAKDLSQDIFVRFWENRDKLMGVKNPAGYLYMLSKNYILNYLRQKVFDDVNFDFLISYFQHRDNTPQEKAELKELEVLFHRAIDSLPGKVKDVFILSRQENLTHAQIAERLGISVVSSKTYVVRALMQIREFIKSHSNEALIIVAFSILKNS